MAQSMNGTIVTNYRVLATDPESGVRDSHFGTEDKKWHTVAKAHSLETDGYVDVEIQYLDKDSGEYRRDDHAMEQLRTRFQKKEVKRVDPRQANSLAQLNHVVGALAKQANKGSIQDGGLGQLVQQCFVTFRTLDIDPTWIAAAAHDEYPDLRMRAPRQEVEQVAQ